MVSTYRETGTLHKSREMEGNIGNKYYSDYSGSLRSKLDRYVRSLLDLSYRNRAIYFAISQDNSSSWKTKTVAFRLIKDSARNLLTDESLTLLSFTTDYEKLNICSIDLGGEDWREVESKLKRLHSKNREFLKDYGFGICYLSYGLLVWKESPGSGKGLWVKTPLFVAEAELDRRLDRRRGRIVYELSVKSPFRLNESLVEAINQQYGIDLTQPLSEVFERRRALKDLEERVLEIDEDGLEDILREIEDVVISKGWMIERDFWVAALSFGTIGIYHDAKNLLESGKLEGSPIIRAICGVEEDSPLPHPDPPEDHDIDEIETPLPADSSQCEVLWYAENGSNLVVHGPPGTGKSQTIANLIARAIAQGRKVLFVAERREAIDVVYSRLKELKLTPPVLRIFTKSEEERREILEDLFNVLEGVMKYFSESDLIKIHERVSFPTREYDRELTYLTSITKPVESSRELYSMIGETVSKEKELGRLGLLEIADRYYGFGVWREYEGVDELALKAYWSELKSILQLPFIPRKEDVDVIPEAVKFLEMMKRYFNEIDYQTVLGVIDLFIKLYEFLGDDDYIRLISFCLKLDDKRFQEFETYIQRILKISERQSVIRRELRQAPSVEELQNAKDSLQEYNSWFKRVFSNNYRKLREELSSTLGIDMNASHREVLEIIDGKISKWYELESLKSALRETVKKVYEKGYDLIFERAYLNRLSYIGRIVKQIDSIRRTPMITDYIRLFQANPYFFNEVRRSFSQELSTSIRELLERVYERPSLQDLLKILYEVQQILKSSSGNPYTILEISEAVGRSPRLGRLIAELPEGIGFEAFKSILEYIRLKESCTNYVKKIAFDHKVLEECGKVIRNFYKELESRAASRLLTSWLKNLARRMMDERYSDELYQLYELLKKEQYKKRRKITLRELFYEYLPTILEVKPILMMSTTAVSSLLPREFPEPLFDIVIFDEASQIPVERALPSIARGRQLVTIGDEKQMPPSRYFERTTLFEEEEEGGEELPESLLHACLEAPRRFFKELWLKWYYRGSHESLIAFSNRYFYNNGLVVLPSPSPHDSRIGFVHVRCPSHPNGGCYIEGRGTNPCEARVVVVKLLEELKKMEDSDYTIGIVAMNERQQELIEDLIDEILRVGDIRKVRELLGLTDASLDRFVGERDVKRFQINEELLDRLEEMWNTERIWVRNLESVQGKEADYVILSMTYGKGRDGKLRQQFGPVNREGGERRINVLISRARERMIVVSSMLSSDLRVEEDTPEGVKVLKDFLRYAEEGGRLVEEREGGWFESPFEESVYHYLKDALSDLGVEIVSQVGVGKYRIDLAVKKDVRYLLGIECDGALYHKHRTARERDKIREDCLKRMGWDIYRIWSTAWFDRQLRERIIEEVRMKVLRKIQNLSMKPS